ncbi:MAG: cysteine desulfurase [Oscillospiraceae bacterium]|nr:cysteine desulfurase [Oscillospiraceae bacterium]
MIYLDNAATTRVSDSVAQTIYETLTEHYGNPSSLYAEGLASRKVLDSARAAVAKAMGCKPAEVYFTACGTESNNIAILGAARARKAWGNKVVVTGFEHPSVQNTVDALRAEGFQVSVILPNADGSFNTAAFLAAVDGQTVLACAMRVNNEIGTVIDTPALAKAVKAKNRRTAFHCDGVQAFGKHPTALRGDIDTMAVSAHKLHGPKGIGALYVRTGFNMAKTQFGGGQEKGLRHGTENIAYAAGFAKAVSEMGNSKAALVHVTALRDRLKSGVLQLEGAVVNSPADASPYIFNFSLPGYRSETLLHFLESRGVLVSSGSACGHGGRSHTLVAMGLADEIIDSALRISFCAENTEADVDVLLAALGEAVQQLQKKTK